MRHLYIIIVGCLLTALSLSTATANDADSPAPIIYKSIVYFYPDTAPPTEAQLSQQLKGFARIEQLPKVIDKPLADFTLSDDFAETYTVPDMGYLQYAGRGLSKSQAEDIQNAKHIVVLDVAFPKAGFLDNYAAVNASLYDIATTHKGLIWDSETRELYTPAIWKEKRLAPFKDGFPSIADHITIHAYNNEGDDGIRAITLGMAKFGSPDVVVNNFSWTLSNPIGNLINLTSQSLLEGLPIDETGTLTLNISELKNTAQKEQLMEGLKDNAEDELGVNYGIGKPEDGDPENAIIEILFDGVEGISLSERQDTVVSALFGWEDSIALVRHDTEVLDASKRAKAKLKSLRKDFKSGLEPGEFILLKAPFKTTSGENEWMWVEVLSWEGKTVIGLLKNEPYHVPDLRAGSEVVINQDDVFDYIRNYADGTSKGNETGKLMSGNR